MDMGLYVLDYLSLLGVSKLGYLSLLGVSELTYLSLSTDISFVTVRDNF